MENAADALKIAFSVLILIAALSLSISCFSQANDAVDAVTYMRDRETHYTYVVPSKEGTRTVGIETIVPMMYRAYIENFEIHFFKSDGEPLPLYYAINPDTEERLTDSAGREIGINFINYVDDRIDKDDPMNRQDIFGISSGGSALQSALKHMDFLLAEEGYQNPGNISSENKKYKNQLITTGEYSNGLYNFLADKKFEEKIGEYEQGKDSTKITKRVVTYVLVP